MIWRLVLANVATLKEIETYYDIVDVWDANEALDLKEEAEQRVYETAQRKVRF
jgi:hypothetical protein